MVKYSHWHVLYMQTLPAPLSWICARRSTETGSIHLSSISPYVASNPVSVTSYRTVYSPLCMRFTGVGTRRATRRL